MRRIADNIPFAINMIHRNRRYQQYQPAGGDQGFGDNPDDDIPF